MNRAISISFILLVLFTGSCDTLLFDEDLASTDPATNFNYLWKQIDEKYAYFDVKEIDWNLVYNEYSAKIRPGMSDVELFDVLADMMKELRDDHTNLISDFDISAYRVAYESPDNFDFRIITDNYLPRDYYATGPFRHDFLLGTNTQIGYIRFASFTGTMTSTHLNFMLDRYKNTRGLIVDLRENGGGASSDVFRLMSRFINQKTTLFYTRIKDGPAHDDFSEPEAADVTPAAGVRYTQKPVIFLVDRGTYSAGSFTALSTKAIDTITLMGDTTGGGLGVPNGGQLPNGWRYRFSVSQALDLAMNNEYEDGVPPDIRVLLDRTKLDTDEVIERAIQQINTLNP